MDDMFGQQAPAEQGEGGEDPFGASTAAVDDPSAGFMGVESAPPLGEGGDMGGFAAEPLPGSDSAGGDAFGGMGGDMPASMGEQNGGADLAAFGGGGADDIMGGAGGDAGGMGGSMGDLGMMGDGMPDMSAPPPDMGAPPPQPAMTQDYEPSAVAKWRMQQAEMIEEKKMKAEAAAQDMLNKANENLERLAKERAEAKEKRVKANREEQTEAQMQRDASSAEDGPAVWTKVGQICDLKEKTSKTVDTNRMRSLLVQMKHG